MGKNMYDVEKGDFVRSVDMDRRCVEAINRVWQYIGADVLALESGGEYDDTSGVTVSRSMMLEIVMDANHMETSGEDREAAAYTIWFSRYHKTAWARFCREKFYSKYGY